MALTGIFFAEYLAMILLPHFWPGADSLTCDMADAALAAPLCALPPWRLLVTHGEAQTQRPNDGHSASRR